MVNNALQELFSAFRKCFIHVLHEHLNDLETSWRSKTSWYAKQSEHLRQARKELDRLLKSRMGHPIFSDELSDLNAASADRDQKVASVMKELETSVHSDMGYLGFDFVQKMEYSTNLFSSLLNVFLLESDIEKYGE
jgi:hypothetical protein